MIERDTRHRNADDSPYGFDEAARHPDRPVIIAYGREAALRLNRLRSRQFPFTTACLPQGGHFSAEELAPWLADLKARDVLIWPMPGEEGGRRALAHANQIAGLGASAVGILKLASVTPFAAANITPMLELEFGKRLRPLILEALDEARALALPQQGDRPAQAVVATSEPADPAAFITSVEEFIARHVPLQKEQARNALSHWCLHAWCVRHPQNPFDLSPRLILQGVNHAGDHARALRVISWLVPSPRIVTCGTAHGLAALARLPRSTLLLDDVDGALLRRNDVTSFVATGARRDASFLSASSRRNMATQSSTCVPTAFAPTAIATEGDLPTRLILHAIVISVRSAKRGSAWSAPAFGAAPEEVRPLRAGMQALAESLVHSIDQTSEAPLPLSSVWQSRNWYPLMALATAIGERSGQAGQGIARLSVQSAFEPGLDRGAVSPPHRRQWLARALWWRP